MMKFTALAVAGLASATVMAAIPAASAAARPNASPAVDNNVYCLVDITADAAIGSTTIGSQVPMNSICRVGFSRINFENVGGTGYYEYEVTRGPNQGLCLKADPNITGGPVVDYTCTTANNDTRAEEEWADPSGSQDSVRDAYDGHTLFDTSNRLWAQTNADHMQLNPFSS